jgi:glucuronate isomerase
MKAFFSAIDDNDEKATRLYTVIGRLDKYFPDMLIRLFNGSSFLSLNPAEVFERISCPFPDEWKDNVRFRNPHDEEEDVDHEVCA